MSRILRTFLIVDNKCNRFRPIFLILISLLILLTSCSSNPSFDNPFLTPDSNSFNKKPLKKPAKIHTPSLSHHSSPASNNTLYFFTKQKHLYALSLNGNLKWKFDAGNSRLTSPVLSATKKILYIGSTDCHLYALNLNGKTIWKFKTKGKILASPTIANDGTIYLTSRDGHLYALSPRGKQLWKFKTKGKLSTSPVFNSKGLLHIYTDNRHVYAILPNGKLKWHRKP